MVLVRPQVLVLVTAVSVQVTIGVLQASVAVGGGTFWQVGTVGLQPRFTDEGGQPDSTGGVTSCTVTEREQLAELPQSSVAVHVRVRV
jgi:hypothetical protein